MDSEERRGNRRVGAAYRAGYAGRRLPRTAEGDSFAEAAHAQGAEDRETGRPKDERLHALGQRRRKSSEDNPADSNVGGSGGEKSSDGSASGAAARPARPRGAESGGPGFLPKIKVGGDGGGLMLAIFIYPIVLSAVQQGAKGPGMWLRAKFLNKTTPYYSPAAQAGSGGTMKARPQ